MVIPKRVDNKVFAAKVIGFILDELSNLREKYEHGDEQLIVRPDEQKYTPFYQCIGKAATLFAVMYKDKVKLTLFQNRRRFAQSARVMDDFVNNFSTSFFQRVESLPVPWFPVIVLTFCGVFGAIADVCKVANRQDLVEVCICNLELDMRTLAEDIRDNGGWRSFYDTSGVFAALYDTRFWNDDSDQEQEPSQEQVPQEPAQEAQEQVPQEPAQEAQEQVPQEPAQEAQEQVPQEPAQEAQEQVPQEPAQEAQEQVPQEPAQEAQEQVPQEPAQEAQEQVPQEPAQEAQEQVPQEPAQEAQEQVPQEPAQEAQEQVPQGPAQEAQESAQEEQVQKHPLLLKLLA